MGIVSCGTVLVSRLRSCGRAAWRRKDGAGAPQPCLRSGAREAAKPYREGARRQRHAAVPGVREDRVAPLSQSVARRHHTQAYDESKRGGSRGTPGRALGGERGGSGSRTRGLAPQRGHWVRSIPVTSCIHCTTFFGLRGGSLEGCPSSSRQRGRVCPLCRLARKP